MFRNKRVCMNQQRISRPRCLLVLHMVRRKARILALIDVRDVAHLLVPEEVVDLLHYLVQAKVWRTKGPRIRLARRRWFWQTFSGRILSPSPGTEAGTTQERKKMQKKGRDPTETWDWQEDHYRTPCYKIYFFCETQTINHRLLKTPRESF